MKSEKKNAYKTGLTMGILGLLAGIGLLFTGNLLIGVFGSIASAALIFKGVKEMKESQDQ